MRPMSDKTVFVPNLTITYGFELKNIAVHIE